ncbi:hypothetical protein E0493_03750 [Roseomonas sp. M0104]|uniref:Cation-transporting P-type ATPase C-terminal domain-containing protein n=1 Tax=Teichococcus coralli TaxID=2545983 RepID=A0A845B7J4_9PROT|nr:hypothetical protein [Pseudoroseomonas coralli]MXP62468.1 hypothetical protein [Pseudoroseomonas coralli]
MDPEGAVVARREAATLKARLRAAAAMGEGARFNWLAAPGAGPSPSTFSPPPHGPRRVAYRWRRWGRRWPALIVVLEIAHLFGIRYRPITSRAWRGVLGTRAVLIGAGTLVVLQLAFTGPRALQTRFSMRPLNPPADGLPFLASGALLPVLLEAETHRRRRLAPRRR